MSIECRLPVAAEHFQIRPDITFFNHGSFGACPRPVFETYQEWQLSRQSFRSVSRLVLTPKDRAFRSKILVNML